MREILDDLDALKAKHVMIMSGSDMVMVARIEGDGRDLDHDLRRLEQQLHAHEK